MAAGIVIAIVIASLAFLGHEGKLGAIAPTDITASNFTEVTASNGLAVGTSQQFQVSSTGVVLLGTSGSSVSRLNIGTCYVRSRATTITASSTALVECQGTAAVNAPWGVAGGASSALTGVSSGDFVQAKFASTTASAVGATNAGMGIVIIGATASSTQGYIQLLVANLTGATYTWPITGAATGTVSYIASN